jgi:CBS domain-containing protein
VVTVDRSIDIALAAAVMRDNNIGYLVVVDDRSGGTVPVGVISDRDIVIKVTAQDMDPHTVSVREIMTPHPLTAGNDDRISDTLRRMRRLGVRRVPVIASNGQVSGVLSVDDVVDHLVSQLADVVGSIRSEPSLPVVTAASEEDSSEQW